MDGNELFKVELVQEKFKIVLSWGGKDEIGLKE